MLATQTTPPSASTSSGFVPTAIGCPAGWLMSLSILTSALPREFDTQTRLPSTAIPSGP